MNNYDLIVVGGGLTGVAAAVSASREGLKVMLVEAGGALGGAAVNNLVFPFMYYWTRNEEGEKTYLNRGIITEICDELKKIGGAANSTMYIDEYMKIVLDRMVKQAGVDVLFHSKLCGVEKQDASIKTISVANKAGVQQFSASYFVDATGDADLAAMSDCSFRLGRESDSLCQPMTLCFRVINVDTTNFQDQRASITKLYREFKEAGKIKNPREDVLMFLPLQKNVVHFNSTRVIKRNPVDPADVSIAEMEAREQMLELFTFLKENVETFKDSEIISSAASIGVRESRMINGMHLLTVDELKNCTKFDEKIAAGNYDIDIHNPDGSGTSHYYFPQGEYYTIPYGCLVPKEVDNLFVGGRCISADHESQASVRIMPICCATGQAAGVASAVAFKSKATNKSADVKTIQNAIENQGGYLG